MDKEFLEALKAIAEGQKELVSEIKKLQGPGGPMVPIRLPDGRTAMVPAASLKADTSGLKTQKVSVIEHPAIPKDPWPDPNVPKPPIVR
jgi:hypothetical protein